MVGKREKVKKEGYKKREREEWGGIWSKFDQQTGLY